MSFSEILERSARAVGVEVTCSELQVDLADGRRLSVPLGWYPRLQHGAPGERARHEFIGGGTGIHWPLLDEDISVQALLEGHPSGESKASLGRWLAARKEPS